MRGFSTVFGEIFSYTIFCIFFQSERGNEVYPEKAVTLGNARESNEESTIGSKGEGSRESEKMMD